MDIQDVLQWTDAQILAKTVKHLDSLQRCTLEQVWQGHKYPEIAKACNRSEDHIKQVARELWKLLSDILGENVKKSNFRSAMERYEFSKLSNSGHFNLVQKGNINNFCTATSHPPKTPQNSPSIHTSNEDNTEQKPRLDLRDAPELKTFYNYPNSPLTALGNAIAHQNCRLLTITGMSGTGKSSIARNLIPQIQTQFDRIIWLSLRTSPPLETTIKNIIQFVCDRTPPPTPPYQGGAKGGFSPPTSMLNCQS